MGDAGVRKVFRTVIKAILFDVDGTLVDSSEAHVAFYQQIFRDAGSIIPARDDIRKIFYLPMNDTLETLALGRPPQEIKRLGVTSTEAVYVGDSPVDGEAAKAAGMRFIACTDIPGADAYFSSFRELPRLISQLGSKTL